MKTRITILALVFFGLRMFAANPIGVMVDPATQQLVYPTNRTLLSQQQLAELQSHATNHAPGGSDPLPWTTIHGRGAQGARPTASSVNAGYLYANTDTLTLQWCDGTQWIDISTTPGGILSVEQGGTGATNAATARDNLGVIIGSQVQGYDTDLQRLSVVSWANGDLVYRDSVGITNLATTSAGRSVLQAASASAQRTALGLVIGTDVAPVNSPVFTGTVTFDQMTVGTVVVLTNLYVTGSTYGAGWNGSTNVPNRNDIYDQLHLGDTDDDGLADKLDLSAAGYVRTTSGGVISAGTTSSNLAADLSDETGTGSVVFSASPALTGSPTVPTASALTSNTVAASTAYVDRAVKTGGGGGGGTNSPGGSSGDLQYNNAGAFGGIATPSSPFLYGSRLVAKSTGASWVNIGSSGLVFDEECLGDPNSGSQGGRETWNRTVGGAGSVIQGTQEAGVFGQWRIVVTNGVTPDRISMVGGDLANKRGIPLIGWTRFTYVAKTRIRNLNVQGTDECRLVSGVISDSTLNATTHPASGIYLMVTNNAWMGVTARTNTYTYSIGPAVVADEYPYIGYTIDVSGGTTNVVFATGSSLSAMTPFGTNTTTLPQVSPSVGCTVMHVWYKTVGSTQPMTNNVDKIKIWIEE